MSFPVTANTFFICFFLLSGLITFWSFAVYRFLSFSIRSKSIFKTFDKWSAPSVKNRFLISLNTKRLLSATKSNKKSHISLLCLFAGSLKFKFESFFRLIKYLNFSVFERKRFDQNFNWKSIFCTSFGQKTDLFPLTLTKVVCQVFLCKCRTIDLVWENRKKCRNRFLILRRPIGWNVRSKKTMILMCV